VPMDRGSQLTVSAIARTVAKTVEVTTATTALAPAFPMCVVAGR